MLRSNFKRGDTIVETMFAFALFGLIAISSLQIMQRGIRITQTALEMNLVRSQMNSQAEALRFLNTIYISDIAYNRTHANGYGKVWQDITNGASTKAGDFSKLVKNGQCQSAGIVNSQAFALGVRNSNNKGVDRVKNLNETATSYARLIYGSNPDSNLVEGSDNVTLGSAAGLWVEAVEPAVPLANQLRYYDFHIRSCWSAPASSAPVTLSTLVRLYAPK